MAEDWQLAGMMIGVADVKKRSRNDHRESLLDCQVFTIFCLLPGKETADAWFLLACSMQLVLMAHQQLICLVTFLST
jgi:hypothetical protein